MLERVGCNRRVVLVGALVARRCGGAGGGTRSAALLSLLGPLAVARHPGRLASLAVVGMPTAPTAGLPQLDAVRVVALALIRLVVPPLALLAGKGDRDTDVSAGHQDSPVVVGLRGAGRRRCRPGAVDPV